MVFGWWIMFHRNICKRFEYILDLLHKERSTGLFASLLCAFATLRETKKDEAQPGKETPHFSIKHWAIRRAAPGLPMRRKPFSAI